MVTLGKFISFCSFLYACFISIKSHMHFLKKVKEITEFIDTESVHNTAFYRKKIIKHSCIVSHFKYLQINTHTMA